MKRHGPTLIFVAVLAAAGWFVFNTSGALPEQVASHFGSSGAADSFVSRKGYVTFTLIFVVGLPLVMTSILTLVFRGATTSLNIPNRDYWLAPTRRAETIAFLTRHSMRFGACLAAFLSFVHWLVVRANARQPVELSNSEIYAGALLFVLTIVVWTVWLLLAFRKPK
ncbi:MAG: DUF1648 domain-containing protein [Rhizobacter sp.]|nr:DUF1648 domain-containing protein [Burkholderiales bacterium]